MPLLLHRKKKESEFAHFYDVYYTSKCRFCYEKKKKNEEVNKNC